MSMPVFKPLSYSDVQASTTVNGEVCSCLFTGLSANLQPGDVSGVAHRSTSFCLTATSDKENLSLRVQIRFSAIVPGSGHATLCWSISGSSGARTFTSANPSADNETISIEIGPIPMVDGTTLVPVALFVAAGKSTAHDAVSVTIDSLDMALSSSSKA